MLNSAFSWVLNQPLAIKNQDDEFFARALKQAHFACGSTHPNPSVGALIARDGHILSEGFTEKPGHMHAEKQAIYRAEKDLRGATLYVTLEPCCHSGRTPPCTEAIIAAGISRVVYGVIDPNPLVAGKGLEQLRAAGIKVEQIDNQALSGLAHDILKPFTKYILHKKPYLLLKIATSSDLAIANKGKRTKITGAESDLVVHQLRRAVDAVMVGANTVRIDNPSLHARLGEKYHGGQPIRIILSSDLNFDEDLAIFATDNAETWIFSPKKPSEKLIKLGVKVFFVEDFSLSSVCDQLGLRGITSVLVEPGHDLLKSFIQEGLGDEIWWFKSNSQIGGAGLSVAEHIKTLDLANAESLVLGHDCLVIKSTSLDHF